MPDDTITIALDGEIPLGEFARTIGRFAELVSALSEDAGSPELDWVIDDLQVSSAIATVRAPGDPQAVGKVIHAFAEVGTALESHTPVQVSKRVRRAVNEIFSIRDPRIRAVRFETAERDALIPTNAVAPPRLLIIPKPTAAMGTLTTPVIKASITASPSLGAIQGRVQSLSNRGALRFTVYDLLYDKAISCYIAEGKEELLRNAWGRLAFIEGLITRDPLNGRPLAIRHVRNITLLDEPPSAPNYETARGVAPSLNDLSPEDAIRRGRDA